MPWEASAPFAIITAATTLTGCLVYGLNHLEYGKPKPVTQDDFDRALVMRDKALKAKMVRCWLGVGLGWVRMDTVRYMGGG